MKFLMKFAEQIFFIYKEKNNCSIDLDTKMTNFAKLWKAVLLSDKTRELESFVYVETEILTEDRKTAVWVKIMSMFNFIKKEHVTMLDRNSY